MNQYETGKHTPDILTLTRIANLFDLPMALFYAEDASLAEVIRLFWTIQKKKTKVKLVIKMLNFENETQ